MSIETIADVTAPLRTYAALLEGRAGDLHQSLLSYYERERGMHEHISVKLDDNKVAIVIPSLKFYCLSRNRLAFVGKDLVAEIEFLPAKMTKKFPSSNAICPPKVSSRFVPLITSRNTISTMIELSSLPYLVSYSGLPQLKR